PDRARLRLERRRSDPPLRHRRTDVQFPRRLRGGRGAVRSRRRDLLRGGAPHPGRPGRPRRGRAVGDHDGRADRHRPRTALRPQHLHDLRSLPAGAHRSAGFFPHDLRGPMTDPAAAPTAILLFNLGGPDDLAAVEPFLVNLFSDREIIELPFGAALQPVIARVIAKLRGPSVRRNYARIGGGSPQLRITNQQAAALEQQLNAAVCGESPYRVFIAMRYSRPSCEDAL